MWCLSALLSSPPLFGWCSFVYRPKQSFCFCDWSSSLSYTFFMFIACFGGPLLMMALSNARILQTYRNSQRRLHQQPGQRLQLQPAGQQQQRQQSKVTSTAADASDKDKSVSLSASSGSSPDGAVVPASAEDASRLFVLAATPSSHPGERLTVAGGVAHHNGTAGRGSGDDAAGSERAKPAAAASAPAPAPALVVADASAAVTPRSEGVGQQQRPQPLQVVQSGPAGEDSMVSLPTRPLFASVLAVKKSLTGASSVTDLSVRQKRKEKRRTEEFQLALSLMVVILVFVICWLPFCVTMFMSVFCPQSLPRGLDMFTLLLGYTNSCINPFIYGSMNRRVKEGYGELWKKLCFYRLWRRQHKTAVMKTTTRCSDTQS